MGFKLLHKAILSGPLCGSISITFKLIKYKPFSQQFEMVTFFSFVVKNTVIYSGFWSMLSEK